MRIQLASDLHLELLAREWPQERLIAAAPGADVLVLAGDIDRGLRAMDEWPQLVFVSADGEHTVGEFVSALGKQYAGGAPAGLANQTKQIVADLSARGYIIVLDAKRRLPYYLSIPVEQQDRDKAKALMEADGFTTVLCK